MVVIESLSLVLLPFEFFTNELFVDVEEEMLVASLLLFMLLLLLLLLGEAIDKY